MKKRSFCGSQFWMGNGLMLALASSHKVSWLSHHVELQWRVCEAEEMLPFKQEAREVGWGHTLTFTTTLSQELPNDHTKTTLLPASAMS